MKTIIVTKQQCANVPPDNRLCYKGIPLNAYVSEAKFTKAEAIQDLEQKECKNLSSPETVVKYSLGGIEIWHEKNIAHEDIYIDPVPTLPRGQRIDVYFAYELAGFGLAEGDTLV
jgi:hypothetical protein